MILQKREKSIGINRIENEVNQSIALYVQESKQIEETEFKKIKQENDERVEKQLKAFREEQAAMMAKQINPMQNPSLAKEIAAIKEKYANEIEAYKVQLDKERKKLEEVNPLLVNSKHDCPAKFIQ